MYFVLTCEIVYLLFCIYFVFKEIKQFVKKGKEHLKNPWSVLEIFLTCLSLTAVGLYFARLAFTKRALKAMNNNLGTSFVSFHYTAFLDEWFKCIIGIIVFLSILKVFRLLRFNRRMSMLQQVLKRCFTQLISFMIMFALAFLAFALLACLVFGQIMEGFGTFLDSCASLMDTLLGKFALKEMSQANRIIGPIFFYSYTVSMVFILINMFVTIINDTFTEVRSDVEKQSNDYEIVDFMIHRLKKNIGKTIGHAIHPVYKEPKSDLELKFDKIVDDADNVMHFMRNMTFEDFRKTRWFQNETCTEKKKNLIRLLMEVDWDYYEDELCDSIPVFERFLSERSEEELEAMLQSYRQKRMVEDLVFDKINGEDSSSQSDSDSDDSSDGHDNTSDDEQSSNDENRLETEPYAESDRRPSTSTYSTSSTSSAKVPGTAARVLTPALINTDVRPETVVELEQHVEENRRKSSFADQGVSDNELLAILEDVQRDVQSRCATDAELDSILYEDTFTPRRCDSNPETSFADKKTKKRKKTAELPVEEKTIKEAWVTVSLTAKEPDDAYENTTEGMDGEQNAKAKNKMGTETASEVEEKQNKRVKKKGKQNGEDHMSAVEDGERKLDKTEKKKKKGQDGVDVGAEDNLQGETRDGEGTKRKKKSAASLNLEVIGESDKKETSGREVAKKEKKTKTIADKAKEEDDGENGSEEQVERESKKESIEISAAEEERAKEGERRKKRKKKKEAMEEKGEEKTKGDVDEETETKKNSNEFSEMFEEVLGSSCDDQTSLKKIKKKGKAKKKLVVEEDDGSGLFKSGETSYGSGEQQKEIKFSMEESSVERKESADQTGLKKMRKKGKAKKKFVLEEEDRSSLFKSGETSYGSGEEQKERKFSLEESSVERKESVA